MIEFNQDNFDKFIIKKGVIGIKNKPITLKSGRESYFYFNWRNVAEDVYSINQLSDYVIAFVIHNKLNPDCFYGIPAGATKVAIITQYKWAMSQPSYSEGSHCLPLGREIPKQHGDPKDAYFVGAPKGGTIMLEDSTTTGDSLIKGVNQLLDSGIKILAAISLTNRNEKNAQGKSVQAVLWEKNVNYIAMSNALTALPKYVLQLQEKPKEEILRNIEEEFRQFGTQELKFL